MSTTNQEATVGNGHYVKTAETVQWVAFRLAEREYGIEIDKVHEIVLMCQINPVAETPDYFEGVINLRCRAIPIVDLRRRFGLPAERPTGDSRIIVLHTAGKKIGIIVDAVLQVLRISQDQIAPPPADAAVAEEYLTGSVKLDDRLLTLLDVDKMLGEEETAVVEALSAAAP